MKDLKIATLIVAIVTILSTLISIVIVIKNGGYLYQVAYPFSLISAIGLLIESILMVVLQMRRRRT